MSATTVPAITTRRATSHLEPGFTAMLRSEWTKLRSLRSTWIMVSLAIGLSIAFSGGIALVSGMTHDSWNDFVREQFDPILTTLGGWIFGMVLVITLGVTSVTSEYSSRTIRTTFVLTPRRGRIFAAKALVLAAVGVGTAALAIPGMLLIAQPIFRHYGLESVSITSEAAIRYMITTVILQGLICTLIPFSFAWLLRGTAAAITTSIGFAVLPWTLTSLVPLWVKENVFRYLPDNAKDRLIGVLKPDAATYLGQTAAIVVIAAWIVGLLVAAAIALHRRDV